MKSLHTLMQTFGIKEFRKLKEIAKKTKCRLKVNSKRGLPFLMNRYRKRKIFFVLLALISVLMFFESRFVWNIEVEGLDRISKEEILESLENSGLKVRHFKI